MNTELFNGLAGIAALVNGLLLWPVIRSLKSIATNHDTRITRLEAPRKKAKRHAKQPR